MSDPSAQAALDPRIDSSLLSHVIALLAVIVLVLFFSGWATYLTLSPIWTAAAPAACSASNGR